MEEVFQLCRTKKNVRQVFQVNFLNKIETSFSRIATRLIAVRISPTLFRRLVRKRADLKDRIRFFRSELSTKTIPPAEFGASDRSLATSSNRVCFRNSFFCFCFVFVYTFWLFLLNVIHLHSVHYKVPAGIEPTTS